MELKTETPESKWDKLSTRFYRKREVYSMVWNVDLSVNYLECSKFGGPIAVTRDHRKGPVIDPNIKIFTSSGIPIATFEWDRGNILKMGWTTREELIVVLESGMVYVFSIFGETLHEFAMKQEGRVIDCITWGEGLVVMTDRLRFYAITNFEEPNPKILSDPLLDREPKSWTVIEPKGSKYPVVLVATVTGTILVVGVERVSDQFLSNGPFRKMALTPASNMLACFTENGEIWVTPSDFQGKSYTFETKSPNTPQQVVWCGSDTVVCCWEINGGNMVLMVGPNDSVIKYNFVEPLILVPEFDGVRIITQKNCEYLQVVQQVTVDTLHSKSTNESALLFKAMEYFYKRSPKADEIIRDIKSQNKLQSAVQKCIEAAGYEFNISVQKSLLKAASFGKCFLDFYTPDRFVAMCKALRVLNEVRQFQIGIPLTINQYTTLTPKTLIERLINRHEHLLASKICEYLNMKTDKVLVHWACTKVKSKEDNNVICNAICSKLKSLPGISYAEIASTAFKVGKPALATELLNHEPRAAHQVPLLVYMQQDKVALNKAIECGDTDLVYLVMLHILRSKEREFINIIKEQPEAISLYVAYCKELNLMQQLQETLTNLGLFYDLSLQYYTESFSFENVSERVNYIKRANNDLNQHCKDKVFEIKMMEEQSKLLMVQKLLEGEIPGIKLIGKSVNQTMFSLIANGQTKQATKVKNDFKVPDKRFWWVKIQALSTIRDWDRLMAFSKEKKSPIGYAPFIDVCLKNDAPQEAVKYLSKIPEAEIRVKYLIKLGAYKEAAIIASKEIKNPQEMLVKIRNNAKEDPTALAAIDQILARYQ